MPSPEAAYKHPSENTRPPEFKRPVARTINVPKNIFKTTVSEGAAQLLKYLLNIRASENILIGMRLTVLPISG